VLALAVLHPVYKARAGGEIRGLVSELARQVVDAFPLLDGVVVEVNGNLADVTLSTPTRAWSPNVELYRTGPSGTQWPTGRRIGFGRILSVERGRAQIEIVSSSLAVGAGDRVRSSLGTVGIGIAPYPQHENRRAVLELLAVRLAYELQARGRFHTEVLGTGAAGAGMRTWSRPAARCCGAACITR
jgi:hypothetical protein